MGQGPNFILDKGYICDSVVAKYEAVKFVNKTHVTKADTLGGFIVGVAQYAVDSAAELTDNAVVDVRVLGITYAIAGSALTLGAPVRVSAAGKMVALAGTAGVNEKVVGIVWSPAAADGDRFELLLTPGALSNAAAS